MTLINSAKNQNSRILSVGAYRPETVVPNSELIHLIDSTDEWIQQRTGIQSRHRASADQSLVDMSVEAAQIAIKRANISVDQIDSIIFATISYPYQAPSAATELAARLGANKAAAFDISAACAGFTYGVGMAADFIRGGSAKYVLVVGGEKLSDFTDLTDRATAFIFADGVGAVIIGPSESVGIGPTIWGSDVTNRDAITLEPSFLEFKKGKSVDDVGWPNIAQEGQRVFRWAVYEMAPVGREAIEAAGITAADLAAFIPHQANERIIDSLVKSMSIPDSVEVARDIRTTGNTSSASIPLAMDQLLNEHPDLHGKNALLIGFGAGLVYAAQVVELPPKPM